MYTYIILLVIFLWKLSLGIFYKSSTYEMIHILCQTLFSGENENEIQYMYIECKALKLNICKGDYSDKHKQMQMKDLPAFHCHPY